MHEGVCTLELILSLFVIGKIVPTVYGNQFAAIRRGMLPMNWTHEVDQAQLISQITPPIRKYGNRAIKHDPGVHLKI